MFGRAIGLCWMVLAMGVAKANSPVAPSALLCPIKGLCDVVLPQPGLLRVTLDDQSWQIFVLKTGDGLTHVLFMASPASMSTTATLETTNRLRYQIRLLPRDTDKSPTLSLANLSTHPAFRLGPTIHRVDYRVRARQGRLSCSIRAIVQPEAIVFDDAWHHFIIGGLPWSWRVVVRDAYEAHIPLPHWVATSLTPHRPLSLLIVPKSVKRLFVGFDDRVCRLMGLMTACAA